MQWWCKWCKCSVSVIMRVLPSAIYFFLLSFLWFKGYTSWVDTTIPGSGLCLWQVLWRQSTTQEVQNRTECHNGTVTDNQEDTQPRLPNPQQRQHNSHGNKRTELNLGELPQLFSQPAELRAAYTGLFPPPRLQQHDPSAWLALSHHGTPKPTATGRQTGSAYTQAHLP